MLRRLLRVVRARSLEHDMEDEMRFHVEMEAADLAARGTAPDEALRLAHVRFGGVARHKEAGLEVRGGRWLADAAHDLRYAARGLRRNPGFALVSVLTAALGIGATTAMFSVVDAVLLKPLPYPDSDRLVAVWSMNPELDDEPFSSSPPDFHELATERRTMQSLSAYTATVFNVAAGGEPERVRGARVSASLFTTLGVSPKLGRGFLPQEGEFGSHRVAVISDELWARAFARDPSIVGRVVSLDREPFTIVGVTPPGFGFPDRHADLWTPIAFEPGNVLNTRGNYYLEIVGRLAPGASIAQAHEALHRLATRVAAEHPEGSMKTARIVPLREQMVGVVRPVLLILLGAIGLVLLIACVNVASLLLARGAARQRELAVRMGLGASRTRLVRQLLAESFLIGVLGAAAGVTLAVAGVALVTGHGPADLPRLDEVGVDGRALAFTTMLAVLTAMAFGLAPAIQASRGAAAETLRVGGRTSTGATGRRSRELLVAVQMAFALVLLIGAGLLIRSFAEVARVNPGFSVERLLTMSMALPRTQYPDMAVQHAFFERVLNQVRNLPGVRSAAVTSALSLGGGYWGKRVSFGDRAVETNLDAVPAVGYRVVTRDYFATMGIAMRAGRDFGPADRAGTEGVAIVNETAARKFWPRGTPLGTTIWMGPPEQLVAARHPTGFRFPRLRVVGVVADERFMGLDQAPGAEFYQLSDQVTERPSVMYLVVRTAGDPLALAAAVRREVRALDPYQPVAELATMSQLVRGALSQRRFTMSLLGAFAALALGLAAIGLYGVVAYSVTQRRREIGLRLALGASHRRIRALVVRQGLRPALVGTAIGVLAAILLTRLMRNMLFGIGPGDPITVLAVASMLTAVAAIASLVPAQRVMRVHPAESLRSDG